MIEYSIVGAGVQIKETSRVERGCLIADRVTIGPHARLEPFQKLSKKCQDDHEEDDDDDDEEEEEAGEDEDGEADDEEEEGDDNNGEDESEEEDDDSDYDEVEASKCPW